MKGSDGSQAGYERVGVWEGACWDEEVEFWCFDSIKGT